MISFAERIIAYADLLHRHFEIEKLRFGRGDDLVMRDIDGMKLALDLAYPKTKELFEMRENGGPVVILPDEFLQKFGMVGQVIKNLRRGQAVMVGKLLFEICHTFSMGKISLTKP